MLCVETHLAPWSLWKAANLDRDESGWWRGRRAALLVSLPLICWLLSAATMEEPIQPPSDCYRPQHLRPSPWYVLLDSISSTSIQTSDFCLPLLSLPAARTDPSEFSPRNDGRRKKKTPKEKRSKHLDVEPGRALCSLPRGNRSKVTSDSREALELD